MLRFSGAGKRDPNIEEWLNKTDVLTVALGNLIHASYLNVKIRLRAECPDGVSTSAPELAQDGSDRTLRLVSRPRQVRSVRNLPCGFCPICQRWGAAHKREVPQG